jgi:hypothetical protein
MIRTVEGRVTHRIWRSAERTADRLESNWRIEEEGGKSRQKVAEDVNTKEQRDVQRIELEKKKEKSSSM